MAEEAPTAPARSSKPDIGQKHLIRVDVSTATSINIMVSVLDRRQLFGREELLVTPVEGNGEAWVTVARFVS